MSIFFFIYALKYNLKTKISHSFCEIRTRKPSCGKSNKQNKKTFENGKELFDQFYIVIRKCL